MTSNHEEYSNDITLENLKCSVQIYWQPATKYLRLTHVFQELTKFSIWQGNWELGYHSLKFRHSPDIS